MSTELHIVHNDPWLKPYEGKIRHRLEEAFKKEKVLKGTNPTLSAFATGHLYYGLQREHGFWVFREWAPNASSIYLRGDFSQWKNQEEYSFTRLEGGNWELKVPNHVLRHGDLFKLYIYWKGGEGYRIPAWCTRVVQDPDTLLYSAQVWYPEKEYRWKFTAPSTHITYPVIYEAHVGMSTEEYRVGTYDEFRRLVLPYIRKAGYNTLQLMAIQEHPYYGSFGYHVSSLFAASSRFGPPEDLKALIDEAHSYGMQVIMDLVHSHAVKNELDGLGNFSGDPGQFFHAGPRREHVAWDSLCYDYGKNEILHFLLSNCAYWLSEFHFDGFRFDGITSMLFYDHGLGKNFTGYDMYFDGNQDEDAITYLILANKLIHELNPRAITMAEDMSGMPGLAVPLAQGGMGFDFRLAMGVPDYWIKIIKELPDEKWNVNEMYYELTNRRKDEKAIGYAESHDQALVGDQTIIFRLMGESMYTNMAKQCQDLKVDRGMALHKIIRMITLATSGSGYLNFMGNEFGHPEWIDFPRLGNNWSYHYARRQWSLLKDPNLRYHQLGDFDFALIHLMEQEQIFSENFPVKTYDSETDLVLAFERKDLLFVFNFHPLKSFTDYGVRVSPGKYKILLTTDELRFGGFGRIDMSLTYYAQILGKLSSGGDNYLKLYLPSRTGIVLKKIPTRRIY